MRAKRWVFTRTRMIDPLTCMPSLVVSRCTLHNLKLIEAVSQPMKRQVGALPSSSPPRALTRQEGVIAELGHQVSIISK